MRSLLALLIAVCPLSAQQSVAPSASMAPQMQSQQVAGGTITGRIFCGDTNAPARLARVSLQRLADQPQSGIGGGGGFFPGGGAGSQSQTDFDGKYLLTSVRPGTYTLRVQADGYVDPLSSVDVSNWLSTDQAVQQQLRSQLPTVTINGTESVTLDIRIERGGTISGQILYDDGSPAAGLNLQIRDVAMQSAVARPAAGARMGMRVLPGGLVRSDDRGNFRIVSVPPGEYFVMTTVTMPQPMELGRGGGLATYNNVQMLYAPGIYRSKAAKSYKVGRGEDVVGVTITIPTRGFHRVTGTVIQQVNGQAITGGNVSLVDTDDASYVMNGHIRHDGTYQVDFVTPGQYKLRVSSAYDDLGDGPKNGMPPRNYYGTAEMSLTVTESDVTSVTLQVPALDDPTRPPQGNTVVRRTTSPR